MSGATEVYFSSAAAAQIVLSNRDSTGTSAGIGYAGEIEVFRPNDTDYCQIQSRLSHYSPTTGVMAMETVAAIRQTNTANVDAFRLYMSAGNISAGRFKLFGRRA